jgi:DNA-directed RNA polymerase subunit RPC12/RpoP
MATYQCKQCGKQFSLSVKAKDCQFCGGSQLTFKGRQSAGANFMLNATSSSPQRKNTQRSAIAQNPTPVYSTKAGRPTQAEVAVLPARPREFSFQKKKAWSSPVSANFWEVFDFVQIGGIFLFLLLVLGGFAGGLYWLANLKFDTKEFQKVAINNDLKSPQKWMVSPGASIRSNNLDHPHSSTKTEHFSLLKNEQFKDVDVSNEVAIANPSADLSVGIATRVNGEKNQNFYYLRIQPDGSFAMGKHTKDTWDDKLAWRKNSAIAPDGKVNRLRIVSKDNLIMGFVNDKKVGSFEDSDYFSGKVALISHQDKGSNSMVNFSNVLIKEREISSSSNAQMKPSFQEAIKQHYQNLENSQEHKSFNFVHNVEIFDQNILKESDDNAQVKVGLRYSLKNGETICESRVINLVFNPKANRWDVKKSENIRPEPTCKL